MSVQRAHISLGRTAPEQLALEDLAACAKVHPALVAYFVEYGLIESATQSSSCAPVVLKEDFATTMALMKTTKLEVMKWQIALLKAHYDLSDRPAQGVTMSRGKSMQQGVRVKLPTGFTWDKLAAVSPEEMREKNLFPTGFFPLPHANHPEGGMTFPKFLIDESKKQEGRDLMRFDLDFDLPDHFLLVTRRSMQTVGLTRFRCQYWSEL